MPAKIRNKEAYAAALSARVRKNSSSSFVVIECELDLQDKGDSILIGVTDVRVDQINFPSSALSSVTLATVLAAAHDHVVKAMREE